MVFNFKLLAQIAFRSLFRTRGTHMRLTPKRVFSLLAITCLYCFAEAGAWVGFLLDEIFFRGYRSQPVSKPVFIIGPPRSGTTYLQRLLAEDEGRFTSMKAWEIHFAPSVAQKKFFKALGVLDSLCGGPLYRLLRTVEKRLFKNLSTMHPTSMFEAEEDGMILLHIFSSASAFFIFPFPDLFQPYFFFDREIDAARRARVMKFYKRCVQRHLYAFGKDKQFFSKNPMFSTMVQSLHQTFQDAKFIYLARTPFQVVPSTVSMITYYFNAVMSPLVPCPFLEEQLQMLLKYYLYPLPELAGMPPEQQQIILYTDLVEHPARTVFDLCARFGFEVSPAYAEAVRGNKGKSQQHTSNHGYSLAEFGLSRKAIVETFKPVFERFGFDRDV